MTWIYGNSVKKVALVSLAFLFVQGCEVPDKKAVVMPEKPYILKHDAKLLTLHFETHHHTLSMSEESQLLSALKASGPGKVSRHLTLPSKASGVGKKQLKHVIRTALQAGLKAKQIHRSPTLPAAKGGFIEVVLDTYRAIPPLCPNWSSTYGTGYDRSTTSNFGCATASNFLLMIDDPIVLFKGDSILSRDAARDSSAIADHRAAKDRGKWLRAEKSDSGASSGSSGGASGAAGGPQQ